MKDGNSLRNQLKAIRTRLGLSQQDLATAAGVARQTIGGIEAELYAPSAAVALRLGRALGCRIEELFWLEDDHTVVEATPASGPLPAGPLRVTLAQVGGRWIAHPLYGEQAFRMEMVPADGVCAPDASGATLAVRLLDEPETLGRTVVLAGCTPVLSLWARSAERWYPGLRIHWTHANSTDALASLARGEVHAAGCHLYDPTTDQHNVPFVQRMLPGCAVVLVNLGLWKEGLVVLPGNPKRLLRVADLARPEVQLINREVGAGARVLLEGALHAEGISTETIAGYEEVVGSHQAVAATIAAGQADVGVSTAAVAAIYGMDFVPLRQVRYDLALLEETLQYEPMRQLLTTLQHRWVRSQLTILGGYDTTLTGQVTAVPADPDCA
jgi:molybdate-binding protein/DNA-binding XRE family transcriptional regulator